jgi:hypothetical protein
VETLNLSRVLTRAINGDEDRASVVTDDVTSRYEKSELPTLPQLYAVADINRWRLSRAIVAQKFAF